MKILWLNWKDAGHPGAGGAEVVLHELCARLIADGHEVTLLTAAYSGAPRHEQIDGVQIIRVGANRYLHPFVALGYYLRRMRGQFDIVIEVVNTAPYFVTLFKDRSKRLLFYHQLAREIWFHEAPFPINRLGYHVIEPAANFLLGRTRTPTLTVSDSTKRDLQRFGFDDNSISVVTQGSQLKPVANLAAFEKYARPTMLSLGAMRAMKCTLDQIKAFELAKQAIPDLQLKVAGDTGGAYGDKVLDAIAASPYKDDIECLGRVSTEKKLELMQKSHVIAVTSLKEGWGLIVTEASSQGTPAVVYDTDGLRDSVIDGQTGVITARTPAALAGGITKLLKNPTLYNTIRQQAWQKSKRHNFDQTYKDFSKHLEYAL